MGIDDLSELRNPFCTAASSSKILQEERTATMGASASRFFASLLTVELRLPVSVLFIVQFSARAGFLDRRTTLNRGTTFFFREVKKRPFLFSNIRF